MAVHTSMIHVRVDDRIKSQAADALAGVGLTLSDAVRILLTRVATEGGLPAGLTVDREAMTPGSGPRFGRRLTICAPRFPTARQWMKPGR